MTGDPWNGRSLEWSTASPPPAFNFAVLPHVDGEDAYWGIKQRALQQADAGDEPDYEDIEMPRNSPTGFICAFFATFMGFAMIWHIWWLVAVGVRGRLRDLRRLRLAGPDRGYAFRPRRSPASTGPTAPRAPRGARPDAAPRNERRSEAPPAIGDADRGHAARDVASKRIIVGYGFWIFLLSDIIMFSAFFATYAVLSGQTAGGPSGKDLFHMHIVAIETACLLLSSFTCGIASIGARRATI